MTVHVLRTAPPPELAQALERFEEQFRYPLGPGRSFRISHGEDYPRFFRAMGEGACFVAERDGRVLGVIGAVLRSLALPGGGERPVLYLGDAKIDPSSHGGRTLLRLAEAVRQWVGARTEVAFAVVMDGTPSLPTRYTGRLGIPPFTELGKIVVLRLPASVTPVEPPDGWSATTERGSACYSHLSTGGYACVGGDAAVRSEMEPLWLVESGGRACGRLEDTRRAKRLIDDDGVEMCSAHLSCFSYLDLAAGVRLLQVAVRRAADRGFPALFVAIAAPEAEAFCQALGEMNVAAAPATIFGTGIEPLPLWNINTAEI